MRIQQIVLISLLLFLSTRIFAQTGTISGTITDSTTQEAISFASVYVDSLKNGMMALIDGAFSIKAEPGEHTLIIRYMTYKEKRIPGIHVVKDSVVIIKVEMVTEQKELQVFEVKATKVTHTENAVINEIKKSDNVVSGISSAQITKSQDRDASEVVKRIPGVTIVENRFIMIRGLNDRYNSVWLNDASAPSSETDKKSFSFDVIPSGLIDRILVFKTPSPELPGDFAGGMVKVYTKSFPDKSTISVNYQTSYRAGTTGSTFYFTDGSKTDWLGYDNGYRELPAGISNYISKNDANISELSKSFKNNWAIHKRNAMPDERFNCYMTNMFGKGAVKFGNTTGLFYTNTLTSFNLHRQDWDSIAQTADYTDIQSTHSIRTGFLENMAVSFKNVKLDFKNFINLLGKDMVTQRTSNFEEAANEKSYLLSYEERKTISSQLSGEYKSSNEKTIYSFTAGYGYNTKNTPDLRRISYKKQRSQPDSMYKAGIANVVDPINGGGRFYSWLTEKVYSFNHSLKQKIKIGSSYTLDINAGNYVEQKNRSFKSRSLGYVIKPGYTAFMLTRYGIDSIFNAENIGAPDKFVMDEITSPSDAYTAQNKLTASYLSLGIPIGKKIKAVAGARYEHNIMSLQGYVNQDSTNIAITSNLLLPSVNASYNFTEKSLLRIAYGKTLNRPEFREWSPFYFYDFDFRAGTYGSLFPTVIAPKGQILKTAEINNYDIRYEWYPRNGEMIQVGFFYKTLLHPIQQAILVSGGSDNAAFSFINAEKANIKGVELEMRKNLSGLDSLIGTRIFSSFNLVGNISFMNSELAITDSFFNFSQKTAMQGQSPYVINSGIYYQNDSSHIQLSLLYNVFGSRIFFLGNVYYPSIGEMARHSLDLTFSKTFRKKIVVSFGVQDILNQSIQLIEDTNRDNKFDRKGEDNEILNYRRGRYFTLGIGLKL